MADDASAPGLYVHLPFCATICPYCDFSVLPGPAAMRQQFVDDLVVEMSLVDSFDRPFDTVYLGGGTPSALTDGQLERILDAARDRLSVEDGAWVSMEANPEDVESARVERWRALGVRALSLGVQSFHDRALRFLGRQHDGSKARGAVEAALGAGFDIVSVDIIFGWPGQTAEDLRSDLQSAADLRPHHLSCYQLTIHPGTPFGFRKARGRLVEMPEPTQSHLFRIAHETLAGLGYEAYEVSNFARARSFWSRHNRKYWNHTPYLGVGPSAHSFDGERRRWWNERKLLPWRAKVQAGQRPIADDELLAPADLVLEALMLGLRTTVGVDLEAIETRWGIRVEAINEGLLDRLEIEGLIRREGSRMVPTIAGMATADGLAAMFRL